MDFGLFCLMPQRDPQKSAGQIAREAVEQAILAEEFGFDAVWFAEHHFSNYSMIPSPLLMAAYAAGQTRRIHIGTGVLVLPLYEPARLIEEIAFVDQISQGRLYLGLGSGYQDYEFTRMGRRLAESQSAFIEFLDIIEKAFRTGELGHAGTHYTIPAAPLGIRPVQKPLPKIFVAGLAQNQPVQERLARSGYVPFLAHHHRSPTTLIEPRARLQGYWQNAGHDPCDMPLATQRFVFVADDRKDEIEAAEHILYTMRLALGLRFGTATLKGSILDDAPVANEPSLDEILAHTPIGSPDRVIEMLSQDIRMLAPSHLSMMVQFGGLRQDKAMRSLELLGTRVLPQLREEFGNVAGNSLSSASAA
jgi:alkanesulfonate monooxygenase SsuD/methylene tetrahydromethanopterin reductase-like flavin-dependent oxidoreductase (luciferase family)